MNQLVPLTATAERKQELRLDARARRAATAADIGFIAGDLIAVQFLRAIQCENQAIVAGYWPKPPECDVMPLLKQLDKRGHPIALPVPHQKNSPLQFRRYIMGGATVPGPFNIPVPPGSAPQLTPAIILLPLLAFDRKGGRLGYGGGFYDITLDYLRAEKDVLAIGIGFAAQEYDLIPQDEWDQPLNWVITENEAIKIG